MKKLLSIVIPTLNNPQYFTPCIQSVLATNVTVSGGEIVVINNGNQPIEEQLNKIPNVRVIKTNKTMTWEQSIKLGLDETDSEFIVFQNDDVFIPNHMMSFYQKLMIPFNDVKVGAVGPVTTCATGLQSIYHPRSPYGYIDVNWLIFFTVMLRRSAVMNAGGIDTTLPGGDDFDLSIRLRDTGSRLVVAPNAFLIHHGFVTGSKIRGDHTVEGGWNSKKMTEDVNHALIKKHGFKKWFTTITQQYLNPDLISEVDKEGDKIKDYLKDYDKSKILELGCGNKKLFKESIAVDKVKNGDVANVGGGKISVADIEADVTKEMPFSDGQFDVIVAEHILEHCLDTVKTINIWSRYLKIGGILVLAVPDENITSSIPMNPEHCHAFNRDSLKALIEKLDFTEQNSYDCDNGVSFISIFKKEAK